MAVRRRRTVATAAARGAKRKTQAKPAAQKTATKKAAGGGGGAKRGRSLKTYALMRKGGKYVKRLNRPAGKLRRYTPLSTPARDVKSSPAQRKAARNYYRKNSVAILKKAKQRYAANSKGAKRYAKAYYRANKPNINYRRSHLRATRKGKSWNLGKAQKRGVGTRTRKAGGRKKAAAKGRGRAKRS